MIIAQKVQLKIKFKSKKVKKIYRKLKSGVGAAVKNGYRLSLNDGSDITVRVDGDGQMDLKLIKLFINPIVINRAQFTKVNRFKDLSFIRSITIVRIIGNIFFYY